jgi:hypothetical protein
VHVAAEADLEHFQGAVPEGFEVFLVHVMVRVRRDFVGAVFAGDFEEGEAWVAGDGERDC